MLVEELRDFKTTPLRERLRALLSSKFARVTYTEAIELLLASNVQFSGSFLVPFIFNLSLVEPYWGLDLGSEHERWLAERN